MRQSQLFGKSTRAVSSEVKSKGLEYLIRGGFIRESSSGRFYLLPLGLRVQERISAIVEDEMNRVGAQRMLAPVLHPIELWEETNRTSSVSFELMRVRDRSERSFVLGGTAEEMLVALVRQFAISAKDLPFCLYQFSTKFRDELRARGGMLRAREFLMKDGYSFHASKEDFERFYREVSESYLRIFKRLDLSVRIVESDNGYMGGDYCHEFVVDHSLGESRYFVSHDETRAIHEDLVNKMGEAERSGLTERAGIEVGNISQLGTWYSDRMKGAEFTGSDGKSHRYSMGCYGIGIGRTLSTIAEVYSDDRGLRWPKGSSPFACHLIALGSDGEVKEAADRLYRELSQSGASVLYDDRELSAGVKFADADLIGIYERVIVSRRLIDQGVVELLNRFTGVSRKVSDREVICAHIKVRDINEKTDI